VSFFECMFLSLTLVVLGKIFGVPLIALFFLGCIAIVSIKYLRSA